MCSEFILFPHGILQVRKCFWMVNERAIPNGCEGGVCSPERTLEQEPAVVQVLVFLTCLSHVAFHLQATSVIVLFKSTWSTKSSCLLITELAGL